MTIRVYTVDRNGTVTEDRGTVTSIRAGKHELPEVRGFPPCKCWRCRSGQAVTR